MSEKKNPQTKLLCDMLITQKKNRCRFYFEIISTYKLLVHFTNTYKQHVTHCIILFLRRETEILFSLNVVN